MNKIRPGQLHESVFQVAAEYTGAIAVLFSSGKPIPFLASSNSNEAREEALRKALNSANNGDVIQVGPGEITIQNTSLFDSLQSNGKLNFWGGQYTRVSIILHPKTVLLYGTGESREDAEELAFEDRYFLMVVYGFTDNLCQTSLSPI